jgi:hypothetical protein
MAIYGLKRITAEVRPNRPVPSGPKKHTTNAERMAEHAARYKPPGTKTAEEAIKESMHRAKKDYDHKVELLRKQREAEEAEKQAGDDSSSDSTDDNTSTTSKPDQKASVKNIRGSANYQEFLNETDECVITAYRPYLDQKEYKFNLDIADRGRGIKFEVKNLPKQHTYAQSSRTHFINNKVKKTTKQGEIVSIEEPLKIKFQNITGQNPSELETLFSNCNFALANDETAKTLKGKIFDAIVELNKKKQQ